MKRIALLLSVILLALAVTATAQTLLGTIEGKVLDEQGGVLPGVTVILIGPRGTQTAVTDAQGVYRFVGVQPATYSVKAELTGFVPQERDGLALSMGKTLGADFSLKVGGITETVEVLGTAATVDVKSSATTTSVSSDLLQTMPIYSSIGSLLNAAPGVNSSSAYGGQGSYGNALLLDGVDTRDPEGGSAWTFFNQDLIEEVQIGGLGAPAEYGGFTGGIINTITRSGGNLFSGLFSMRYTTDDLASSNITDDILTLNPSLGSSDITRKLADYTVQMGGPVKQDKAFFYASIQRFSADYDPIGPLKTRTEISPRFNVKLTFQPSSTDTITLGGQYDQYNVTGRIGYWPGSQATDNATVEEDAPEWVWNAQWRKVFGASTLLEAKFTGYNGYYYLDPVDPSPVIYDAETDAYGGGGGGLYYADRGRNQVNVSLTKYAEKFGRHSFKFGAEIERSHVRSQYQPYGPAGFYIYQYGGVPYYQVSYGYDLQGDNRRTSAFAQDQWTAGRLTFNLGVRMDHIRGFSPTLDKNVYTPKTAWGPRLGAAFDVTGKGTTVLRGFWGRYYEGPAAGFFYNAAPGIEDYVWTPINPDGSLGVPDVLTPAFVFGMQEDIKHPRTDDANVAWEQQLSRTLRFTATGIWRKTGNFINNVVEGAIWDKRTLVNQLTNQPYTAYYWDNRDETNTNFVIRNTEGFNYQLTDGSVIAADPSRDYKALMLLLNKQLRNRWGFQASYVLAKAEGTVDNSGFGNWLGGHGWVSPNTGVTNNFGELTNSRRHEFKLYGTYQLPVVEVMLSGVYTGTSGRPFTPYGQPSTSALNVPGSSTRRQIFLAPRGSERNDFYNNFDLRAEKVIQVQGHRFGLFADITNLMNTASITSRQTRVPSTSIGGNTVLYKSPTGVQGARQVTFGGRWSF